MPRCSNPEEALKQALLQHVGDGHPVTKSMLCFLVKAGPAAGPDPGKTSIQVELVGSTKHVTRTKLYLFFFRKLDHEGSPKTL